MLHISSPFSHPQATVFHLKLARCISWVKHWYETNVVGSTLFHTVFSPLRFCILQYVMHSCILLLLILPLPNSNSCNSCSYCIRVFSCCPVFVNTMSFSLLLSAIHKDVLLMYVIVMSIYVFACVISLCLLTCSTCTPVRTHKQRHAHKKPE
jgi:hypothetical protein